MLGLASIYVEVSLLALSGFALALAKAKAGEPSIDTRQRLPHVTGYERRVTSANRSSSGKRSAHR